MEYVTKAEIKPYRKIFFNSIENIRDEIKSKGITFIYRLVGSAKRNLVIKDNNKGFDCDYQIIIKKNKNNLSPNEIKNIFSIFLNKELKKENFNPANNSTSSITFRKVDKENNLRLFGYDIVILRNNNNDLEILRCKKDFQPIVCLFEILPDMKNSTENFKKIIGPKMWKTLREKYLEKKILYLEKDIERKSFQILNETVNEILKIFNI